MSRCPSSIECHLVAAVTLALSALLALLTGCASTCPPCMPEVRTITSPPEVVTVLGPAPTIPPRPELQSTTPEGLALAASDPAAWLRLLAGDLLRALDAYDRARGELEAIAAARAASATP
jgi:hypothetical protein